MFCYVCSVDMYKDDGCRMHRVFAYHATGKVRTCEYLARFVGPIPFCSIIGPQQYYLREMETRLWREGDKAAVDHIEKAAGVGGCFCPSFNFLTGCHSWTLCNQKFVEVIVVLCIPWDIFFS